MSYSGSEITIPNNTNWLTYIIRMQLLIFFLSQPNINYNINGNTNNNSNTDIILC